MATVVILFNGGPCDKQRVELADPANVPTSWICQGTIYNLTKVSDTSYLASLPSAAPVPPEGDQPPAPEEETPLDGGLAKAWSAFMWAFGRKAPEAVNASARARTRIRMAGRR